MRKYFLMIVVSLSILLAGCSSPSDPGDKLVGKWKEENGFTIEITKDSDSYTCALGIDDDSKSRMETGGKWDEEKKNLIFYNKKESKNIYIGYDEEKDQLLQYFKSGNSARYSRVK
ncbi:MAG: hypothetical protein N2645_17770 [Clostridia bacterium]|nr:hypothetical protein [Clostridia bacterium]